MVVLPNPLIQVGLEFFDGVVDFLAEGDLVKLCLNGAVKAFANAIGLRVTCFGLGMVNILDSQIQLILMVFHAATILGTSISEHPQQSNFFCFEKG